MTNGINNERYLLWYSNFFESKYASGYQTIHSQELINIYQELATLGFKLSEKEEGESSDGKYYYKKYLRNQEEINIYVFSESDVIEIGYVHR